MNKLEISAFDLAMRFVGVKEIAGTASNQLILSMLRLDQDWPEGDHVPWCSAFLNYVAWLLRLPRSKSLAARSWLLVGRPIQLEEAEPGFGVIVLKRGSGNQPGPSVIDAPGHVGYFAALEGNSVLLLGGNQSNSVSVEPFSVSRLLGVRRLL